MTIPTPEQIAAIEAQQQQVTALAESVRVLQAQNAQLLRDAETRAGLDLIRSLVAESALPTLAQQRLLASVQPVLTEAGQHDADATRARAQEAITQEAAYLAALTPAGVRGMGQTQPQVPTVEGARTALAESFAALGLPGSVAQIAAAGR